MEIFTSVMLERREDLEWIEDEGGDFFSLG
jgi:hypothetical protein